MNKSLEDLRAAVRKRRSQVTAKENRIKRNTGVDLRDTPSDPRRPVNVVRRYSARQLNAYLRELNTFMLRDNGFVAGINNTAIPKADWIAYKKIERQYNAIGQGIINAIGGILNPVNNMTILERENSMIPKSKRAQGDVVHRPFGVEDRKPGNIKDAAALAKIRLKLEKKLKSDYLPAQIEAGRAQLSKLLVGIGEDDSLLKKAAALTDSQFNILWNYTNFATAVSAISPSGGHRSSAVIEQDSSNRYMSGVVSGYGDDIRVFFDWAKTLPETGTEPIKTGSIQTGARKKGRRR